MRTLCILGAGVLLGYWLWELDRLFFEDLTPDEMRVKYDGYRLCLRTAHICRMEVEDFLEYHRLQVEILALGDELADWQKDSESEYADYEEK